MEDNLTWFTSTFSSGNGQCVECARLPGNGLAVRDTKNRSGAVLKFAEDEWNAFLASVQRGKPD
jgi:hypothetical protein